MSFPRYPKYKDSGVEWLGQVPEHWEVDRIKRSTASCQNGIWGDEPQGDENDIPCIRVADFDRERLQVVLSEPTIRNVTERERAGRVLRWNDLLLEKSGGGETQPVGCVVLYVDTRPAVCSNFVARVEAAEGMSPSFWRYVHAASYAVRLNTRSIKQTSGIQNLDAAQYFDERAGFPPLSEQITIAEFLDRETGKIDELVAEQRRLMELLKEKRQAVISHAVTRGLNPAAPLKPSGIEWLGDVPTHWTVGKLGHASKLRGGFAFSAADFGTDGTVVVRMNNLKRGRLDLSEAARIPETSCNEGATLSDGDLVWGMSGSTGETGSLGNYARVRSEDLPCQLNQRVGRFAANPNRLDLDFLEQVIQTAYFYEQVMLLVTGTAQFNVSSEQVESCLVAIPPLMEQREISAFLATELAKLDALTAEAQRAIDLLQERRTALISAAVTGQIDVRHLAESPAA